MVLELLKMFKGLFKSRQSIVVVYKSGAENIKVDQLVRMIQADFPSSDYNIEEIAINLDDMLHESDKISSFNPPTIILAMDDALSQEIDNYLIVMRPVMAAAKNIVFAFISESPPSNAAVASRHRQIISDLSQKMNETPAKIMSIDVASDRLEEEQVEQFQQATHTIISTKALSDRLGVIRNTEASIMLFGGIGSYIKWGAVALGVLFGIGSLFLGASLLGAVLLAGCGVLVGGFLSGTIGFLIGLIKNTCGCFNNSGTYSSDQSAGRSSFGSATEMVSMLDDKDTLRPATAAATPQAISAAQPPVTSHPANLYRGLLGDKAVDAYAGQSQQQSDYTGPAPSNSKC